MKPRRPGATDVSDDDWRHLVRHAARSRSDGQLELRYDPAIGRAFTETTLSDIDLWQLWDGISCPVLVLRGTLSDLLLPETAAEMRRDFLDFIRFPLSFTCRIGKRRKGYSFFPPWWSES